MPPLQTRPAPLPDELWLSRPPNLMIARILSVEEEPVGPDRVSYVLYDEDGAPLEHVDRAALDAAFWHTFQPLTPRRG
jgi:hypothetical protein